MWHILLINHSCLGKTTLYFSRKTGCNKTNYVSMSGCLGNCFSFKKCFPVGQHVHFSQRPKEAQQRPTPAPHNPRARTGGRVLQELFDLCWGKLRSGHGEADPQLLQGRFDVGLFKVGIESRRGNSPRSAIGWALNNVNDHFRPEQDKTCAVRKRSAVYRN